MKKSKQLSILLLILVLSLSLVACGGGSDSPKQTDASDPVAEDLAEEPVEIEEPKDDVPREHKSALNKATLYANDMHMSKAGIYDQLISEHGEGFPEDAAKYAIENVEADWNENALNKAKIYANDMDMSNSAVYDQLISEHGEKFLPEEAQYAVDNLD